MSVADALAVIGIVIAFIALGLSVYVYQWSKKDLQQFTSSTEQSIHRWSEVTIRIEGATGRIEKVIETFTKDTFSLVRDHYVRATERPGADAAEREAARAEKLVSQIQAQSGNEIGEILNDHGVDVEKAPALQTRLSAVFADGLKRTRAASDRARNDTLREEVLRVIEDHEDDGLTLAAIEDLLGASYARSDIATSIDSLKLAGVIHLTPDEFKPEALVRTRRAM